MRIPVAIRRGGPPEAARPRLPIYKPPGAIYEPPRQPPRQPKACTELSFGRSIVVYDPGEVGEEELSPRSALQKRIPSWMLPSLASTVLHQAGAAVSQSTSSAQARGILHGLKHGHTKKPAPPPSKPTLGDAVKLPPAMAVTMPTTESDVITHSVEL